MRLWRVGEPLRGSIQWKIFRFLYNHETIFFEISKNANAHQIIITGKQVNVMHSKAEFRCYTAHFSW